MVTNRNTEVTLESILTVAFPEHKYDTDGNLTEVSVGDHEKARQLADEYVAAHADEFKDFEKMSIEDVVRACETFRAAGMRDMWARAEAWHFHRFEPQNIGGAVQPQIRVPGSK